MESAWWRTLAAPLIVAIFAAFFAGRLSTPELPSITAVATWTNVEGETVSKLAGVLGAAGEEWARYRSKIRIVTISIQNNASVRSKELEISVPDGFFLKSASTEHRMKIAALDPGGSTNVAALLDDWYDYQPAPITILHDGRRVNLTEAVATGSYVTVLDWANRYPALIALLVLFGGLALILISVLLPLGFLLERSCALRHRLTRKKELEDLWKFIEWVKVNHPESLPGPAAQERWSPNER